MVCQLTITHLFCININECKDRLIAIYALIAQSMIFAHFFVHWMVVHIPWHKPSFTSFHNLINHIIPWHCVRASALYHFHIHYQHYIPMNLANMRWTKGLFFYLFIIHSFNFFLFERVPCGNYGFEPLLF